MPAGPAPVPSEVAPSDWKTYHNGHYGYSIAYHSGMDVEVEDRETVIFSPTYDALAYARVDVYQLNSRVTLENFASLMRDTMKEHFQNFDVFRFTEYAENGRNFYRIYYRSVTQSKGSCGLYGVKQISLSYAFPVKPYGYIVDFTYCNNGSRSLSNWDTMLNSFREWDFYQSESQGWSIAIAPGWTAEYLAGDGILVSENDKKGSVILRSFPLENGETLAEFAERDRDELREKAVAERYPLFESIAFGPAAIRYGRETYQFTYREHPDPQHCSTSDVVIYAYAESGSGPRRVIQVAGSACESSPDVVAARDAFLDGFRP